MLRALTYFWRVNVAVALGAAVAAAVLTGALLVGDSVRDSLRDLALDRLGRIDAALLAERFFRDGLAADLERGAATPGGLDAVPVILLRGAATHAGTLARASRVTILGVDGRFEDLYPSPAGASPPGPAIAPRPGQTVPSLVVNESLRRELGARVGEAVLLSFARATDIPRASLAGRRDPGDVLGTLRCTLAGVVPDSGPGRFALSAHQGSPLNAFVALADLQRALGLPDRVNGLLVAAATGPAGARDIDLRGALRPEDLGLTLRPGPGYLAVQSREFLLRPAAVDAIEEAAVRIGAPVQHLQTYLANTIRKGERMIPYSMITAIGGAAGDPFPALRLTDGSPAPALEEDEILLNAWAAGDLDARPGDSIELTYFSVGPRDDLETASARLRLRGVVALRGLGDDRSLTPEYPGIQDARRMSAWDPPFPIELSLIRPRDEAYWDEHRATPKGFVAERTGRRLWSSRYGDLTALRLGIPPGIDPTAMAGRLREELVRTLDPGAFGLRLDPVKEEALRSATGATDFSGLFIGFSMFLIAAAALLAALLFRLGVEQRAREVGLLLAVGYRAGAVRRRFLAEGGLLALAGAILGLAGGTAYAGLMMLALRTIWLPAVGSPQLFLHVRPATLALGGVLGLAVVFASIGWSVRRLGRIPAAMLLAGSMRDAGDDRGASRPVRVLAWGGLAAAAALLLFAALGGRASSPGLFFGSGSALLIAGLAFFALWCRRPPPGGLRRPGGRALARMAARNSAWNPGRSILSVALVGSACFVIVTVAAQRGDPAADLSARDSGSGGYRLVATSDVPLHQDLDRPEGRADLGFQASAAAVLEGTRIVPFRVLPGDDASCLNLYRPSRPRVLGVPAAQIRRGGFRFSGVAVEAPNPWRLLGRNLGPGVVPAIGDANSVLWILHLGLDKDLVLTDGRGREVRLRFVALLQGSLFQSEVLIAEDRFRELFPARSGFSYFLIDAPAPRAAALTRLLEETLRPFGFDVTSAAETIAAYHVVESTYLSTFQTLGGLGLLLGTLGLGIVLLRNIIERRGELATLRAFGYRRAQLASMVFAENAFLLCVGMALGGGAAFVAVTPHLLAAGAGVPWLSLAGTLGGVLLAGMIASIAAVRGALRAPLLPVLKAER